MLWWIAVNFVPGRIVKLVPSQVTCPGRITVLISGRIVDMVPSQVTCRAQVAVLIPDRIVKNLVPS